MRKNNQKNKWLALINIPLQMGVVIFVFAYIGQWLDGKYPNVNNNYTKGVTMFGVFLSLYNVYRQVKDLNKYD
jgi:hypothetical protein